MMLFCLFLFSLCSAASDEPVWGHGVGHLRVVAFCEADPQEIMRVYGRTIRFRELRPTDWSTFLKSVFLEEREKKEVLEDMSRCKLVEDDLMGNSDVIYDILHGNGEISFLGWLLESSERALCYPKYMAYWSTWVLNHMDDVGAEDGISQIAHGFNTLSYAQRAEANKVLTYMVNGQRFVLDMDKFPEELCEVAEASRSLLATSSLFPSDIVPEAWKLTLEQKEEKAKREARARIESEHFEAIAAALKK